MLKRICKFVSTLCLLSFLITGTQSVVAIEKSSSSSASQNIPQVVLEEFLKDQLKNEIKNYLNNNPHIIGFEAADVGTKFTKYLGVAIAAYNLLSADSDKQKLFAAMQVGVYFSPEPYSQLILMAIQMIDLVLSMNHMMDMFDIYLRIEEARAMTLAIVTRNLSDKFEEQMFAINQVNEISGEIIKIHNSFNDDPTMKFIKDNNTGVVELKEMELLETLQKFQRLLVLFVEYDIAKLLFEQIVDVDAMDEFKVISDELSRFEKNLKGFRDKFNEVMIVLENVNLKFQSEKELIKIDDQVKKHRQNLQKYVFCSNAVNRVLSMEALNPNLEMDFYYLDLHRFVKECEENFNLGAFKKIEANGESR